MSPLAWHIAAPDVCDGTSAVGESRHRIPGASVGQPTEPWLAMSDRRVCRLAHHRRRSRAAIEGPPPRPKRKSAGAARRAASGLTAPRLESTHSPWGLLSCLQ